MNSLSPDEQVNLQSWFNLRHEGSLPMRLGMYRVKWPRVYRAIIEADDRAHEIAIQRGWIEKDRPIDTSEAGIAANLIKLERLSRESPVAAALAELGLSILRKAVERQAPDKLHLIPDGMKPQPHAPRVLEPA